VVPEEAEELDSDYRSHGSLYEMDISLLMFNPHQYPNARDLQFNFDLTRLLFQ